MICIPAGVIAVPMIEIVADIVGPSLPLGRSPLAGAHSAAPVAIGRSAGSRLRPHRPIGEILRRKASPGSGSDLRALVASARGRNREHRVAADRRRTGRRIARGVESVAGTQPIAAVAKSSPPKLPDRRQIAAAIAAEIAAVKAAAAESRRQSRVGSRPSQRPAMPAPPSGSEIACS